jgi:hypothetical protein
MTVEDKAGKRTGGLIRAGEVGDDDFLGSPGLARQQQERGRNGQGKSAPHYYPRRFPLMAISAMVRYLDGVLLVFLRSWPGSTCIVAAPANNETFF